jgi:hypothetical protein
MGGHRGLGGAGVVGADHAGNADEIASEGDQLITIDTGENVGDAHGWAR